MSKHEKAPDPTEVTRESDELQARDAGPNEITKGRTVGQGDAGDLTHYPGGEAQRNVDQGKVMTGQSVTDPHPDRADAHPQNGD